MPNLLFQPTFERHTTLSAVFECPKKYEWLTKVRSGQLLAGPPSQALAIGIGMDVGVGMLWGNEWVVAPAVEAGCAALDAELLLVVTPPQWDRREVFEIISSGIRQYADQWVGSRQWDIVVLHPYLDTAAWVQKVGVPGLPYIPMPDALFRIDGTLTIVDLKTGRYAYNPNDWLTDPQMIVNAAMVARAWKEPVCYMVDYCQKPSASKSRSNPWIFPATMAMVLDEAKADLAWAWVREGLDLIHHYETLRRTNDGLTVPHFPRALNACRGKYGLCEFYDRGCVIGVEPSPSEHELT